MSDSSAFVKSASHSPIISLQNHRHRRGVRTINLKNPTMEDLLSSSIQYEAFLVNQLRLFYDNAVKDFDPQVHPPHWAPAGYWEQQQELHAIEDDQGYDEYNNGLQYGEEPAEHDEDEHDEDAPEYLMVVYSENLSDEEITANYSSSNITQDNDEADTSYPDEMHEIEEPEENQALQIPKRWILEFEDNDKVLGVQMADLIRLLETANTQNLIAETRVEIITEPVVGWNPEKYNAGWRAIKEKRKREKELF